MVPLIGFDAVVFLRFLRMLRYMLSTLAILGCAILIPVDVVHNKHRDAAQAPQQHANPRPSPSAQPASSPPTKRFSLSTGQADMGSNSDQDPVMYVSMAKVTGSSLWAHVVITYIATIVVLAFVYINYCHVVRLRTAYFTSPEYQGSYHARALMFTDIRPQLQNVEAMRNALGNIRIPYPATEVQVGRSVERLPRLLEEQRQTVFKLEHALNQYMQHYSEGQQRPSAKVGAKWFRLRGGVQVDVIEYYGTKLRKIEGEIADARAEMDDAPTDSFGFASLAAIPYAHAAARLASGKRPMKMHIELAPSPRDVIWENLMMPRQERLRSKRLGSVLFVVLFLANLVPLFIVSAVSNLSVFQPYVGVLRRHQTIFGLVSGVAPPLITTACALALPLLMRRIATFRGVYTRERRGRALLSNYFLFLALTQFLVFTLIGVVLGAGLQVYHNTKKHESAKSIANKVSVNLLSKMSYQLPFQSFYWMSWATVRGYLLVFELAQVPRLCIYWMYKHILSKTPREMQDFARPPNFLYWMHYAELLFLAGIGIIYMPLAPLVIVFAAAVFWIASVVFKYQLLYVYRTKCETGGRLWHAVINRLLLILVFMQLAVGVGVLLKLQSEWIKAISCIPPMLFVLAFKVFSHYKMEPRFLWYDPSPLELARTKIHVNDVAKRRLERHFGHPFVHDPLLTPMVDSAFMPILPHVYNGRVEYATKQDGGKINMLDVEAAELPTKSIYDDGSLSESLTALPLGSETDLGQSQGYIQRVSRLVQEKLGHGGTYSPAASTSDIELDALKAPSDRRFTNFSTDSFGTLTKATVENGRPGMVRQDSDAFSLPPVVTSGHDQVQRERSGPYQKVDSDVDDPLELVDLYGDDLPRRRHRQDSDPQWINVVEVDDPSRPPQDKPQGTGYASPAQSQSLSESPGSNDVPFDPRRPTVYLYRDSNGQVRPVDPFTYEPDHLSSNSELEPLQGHQGDATTSPASSAGQSAAPTRNDATSSNQSSSYVPNASDPMLAFAFPSSRSD